MTKDQYLSKLRTHLAGLSPEEQGDILRDQEEFIREGLLAGRSEESIIKGLGDPQTLASSLKAQMQISKATSSSSLGSKARLTWGALVAVLALAPLNFIFLLGPVLVVFCLLVAGWSVVLSLGAAGVAGFVAMLAGASVIPFAPFGHLAGFSLLFGFLGLTFLTGMLLWLISKGCLNMFLKYLQWNVQFVRKQVRD